MKRLTNVKAFLNDYKMCKISGERQRVCVMVAEMYYRNYISWKTTLDFFTEVCMFGSERNLNAYLKPEDIVAVNKTVRERKWQ